MKDKSRVTRPLVICIFRNDDKILACLGKDTVKNTEFYRPLGGMIEFGEHSKDALRREIAEEISQDITNIKYLGILENIFTYNGKPHHEIVIVYDAGFEDESMYQLDEIKVNEVDIWYNAYWLRIEDCRNGKYLLYPEGLTDLI